MNTQEVASAVGTSPRQLRQFLRSGFSTFVPVGSGGRYDFTEREIPTIRKRFIEWQGAGKPRPVNRPAELPSAPTVQKNRAKLAQQRRRDEAVWAEEGEVVLPDIRNPRVRKRALADARAAEDRLMFRLMAVGLHLTQLGDVRNGKKKSA